MYVLTREYKWEEVQMQTLERLTRRLVLNAAELIEMGYVPLPISSCSSPIAFGWVDFTIRMTASYASALGVGFVG